MPFTIMETETSERDNALTYTYAVVEYTREGAHKAIRVVRTIGDYSSMAGAKQASRYQARRAAKLLEATP